MILTDLLPLRRIWDYSTIDGRVFGYVEQRNSHRFRRGVYEGIIREATDSQPFVGAVRFTSSVHLLKTELLLVDTSSGNAITLFPLYYVEEFSDRPSGVNWKIRSKLSPHSGARQHPNPEHASR